MTHENAQFIITLVLFVLLVIQTVNSFMARAAIRRHSQAALRLFSVLDARLYLLEVLAGTAPPEEQLDSCTRVTLDLIRKGRKEAGIHDERR